MELSRKGVRVLGDLYLARCDSGFEAYMALQRALIARWVAHGGTEQGWCERMAPHFRRRYGWLGFGDAAVAPVVAAP
jgi:hypothetical protein